MEIQASLGSDIAMVLDECPPYPCEHEYAARSLGNDRALGARDAKQANQRKSANQKSARTRNCSSASSRVATFEDLRRASAEATVAIGFDGYAIGGVSVGEPEPEMMQAVEWSEPFLPNDKPRYAMGLALRRKCSS